MQLATSLAWLAVSLQQPQGLTVTFAVEALHDQRHWSHTADTRHLLRSRLCWTAPCLHTWLEMPLALPPAVRLTSHKPAAASFSQSHTYMHPTAGDVAVQCSMGSADHQGWLQCNNTPPEICGGKTFQRWHSSCCIRHTSWAHTPAREEWGWRHAPWQLLEY